MVVPDLGLPESCCGNVWNPKQLLMARALWSHPRKTQLLIQPLGRSNIRLSHETVTSNLINKIRDLKLRGVRKMLPGCKKFCFQLNWAEKMTRRRKRAASVYRSSKHSKVQK
jgi:hypothetical protein